MALLPQPSGHGGVDVGAAGELNLKEYSTPYLSYVLGMGNTATLLAKQRVDVAKLRKTLFVFVQPSCVEAVVSYQPQAYLRLFGRGGPFPIFGQRARCQ